MGKTREKASPISSFPPYLGPGDEEEAASQQQPLQRRLEITELYPFQVKDTLAVGQDEGIQRQDLEHLKGGDQGATALLDHMADCSERKEALVAQISALSPCKKGPRQDGV